MNSLDAGGAQIGPRGEFAVLSDLSEASGCDHPVRPICTPYISIPQPPNILVGKDQFGKGGQGGFFILRGEALVIHERLIKIYNDTVIVAQTSRLCKM
jgi:hypothetical protein